MPFFIIIIFKDDLKFSLIINVGDEVKYNNQILFLKNTITFFLDYKMVKTPLHLLLKI